MKIVLISTYELGRQPFGLASPAAWLRAEGAEVACFDLSREALPEMPVREADVVAFYVPMHTATRLAVALLPRIRELNPARASLFLWVVRTGERNLFARFGRANNSRRGIRRRAGGVSEPACRRRGARRDATLRRPTLNLRSSR